MVRLWLTVRRFLCAHNACPQRTFVERFPDVVPFRARRTHRLTCTLQSLVATLSAKAGARLATKLCIRVSHDTLTRLLRDAHPSTIPTPRVLGVDDCAFKKGHRYGTIFVDLERHQPVDVLPDRRADTLATWLREHPGIEIIARDRSTEYARGATLGAPSAQQVADRWHLLQNLRDVLERLCGRLYTILQKLPPIGHQHTHDDQSAPVLPAMQSLRPVSGREQAARAATRERRRTRYEQVRMLSQAGVPHLQIAHQLQISRNTVRHFATVEAFPERAPRAPQARLLDRHQPYLEQRWHEGCTNASQLWRELRQRGYSGVRKHVARWVQHHRTEGTGITPLVLTPIIVSHTTPKRERVPRTHHIRLPSPRQLTWLLLNGNARGTDEAHRILAHIHQHETVVLAQTLAQQFHALLRERTPEMLDGWLQACAASEIGELQSFAASLRADEAAVRAAWREEWSTGQVEGQNTRRKLLKREMYGRAKFDLLRQRVLTIAY